jgi:predicted RNA binding protein YcfA (HicA-like mRNA interferase family)
MSPRLPALKARNLIRALRKAGFFVVRVTGSHYILKHEDGRPGEVVVPYHGARDLKRGTLNSILKQANLNPEELQKLL